METYLREPDFYGQPLRKRYGTSMFLNLHRKYRSDFEIFALILEGLKAGGAGRYLLMKHTGVNYAQLDKFLKALMTLGFILPDKKDGQVFYRATENGLDFLGQYYVLLSMLLNAAQNATQNGAYEGGWEAVVAQQKAGFRSAKK